MIAFSRPFLPLFLHVLGAMLLFGAVLTTAVAAGAGLRQPRLAALRRTAWWSTLWALPAYVLMRGGAAWIYSHEREYSGTTWIGIGNGVADLGLLVLLAVVGGSYWWLRSGGRTAARAVALLAALYLALLAVAWLAMAGKWG